MEPRALIYLIRRYGSYEEHIEGFCFIWEEYRLTVFRNKKYGYTVSRNSHIIYDSIFGV